MDHLTPLRRLHGTNVLRLAIGLPLRNREGLTNLLERLYDPGSPEYRHYLTPEQFTERFGPSREDYQAVSNFALAHGLTVTAKHPNRALLDVSAPAATVEKAFHVVLHEYQHPKENRTFFAPDVEPSVELAVPILQVSGLNNYALPKPRFKVKPANKNQTTKPNAGSGTNGGYMGNDFRAAYVPDTSLTGAGQSVGLLQFDGYTASDITNYENQAGLPNVTVTNVLLDGFNGAPTGTGGEVEVSLDIEMTISMAPGLNKVIVYEAGPTGDWYDLLNRMATDNQAKQLSCSWYQPNGLKSPVADGIFQQMIAQGQSFFNASGDHDAFTGLIDFPGDSPYITQVGGTLLTTSTNGGPWVSEEVWNRDNDIGSGGGISTQYPIPSWQTNISMANNQGSTTMRNVPDVALTADDIYVRADGIDLTVGGTSCAAPLWAGFMALVNQQAAASGRTPVGFINPAISAIGLESGYSQAFHDITVGANTNSASPTQFIAVPGYDLATGWGSPNGQALINALATPDALSISPVTGFTVSGGPTGPFANTTLTLTLTNTGTNNLIWTLGNTVPWLDISPNGGGTLTRGGPSSSVTVSLNAATSNLVAGTHSAKVWFTNLNDGVGVSRTFTLNIIEVPTITSQPTNVSLLVGGTASFRVAVVGRKPFSYQWFFNTDSLPDATNATLTLSNVATNQSGSYSVVVTNTNGSATSVAAMLTVIPKAINDLCSGAIDISVNNYINTQTTTNATSAGDPVPDCVDHFDQGVWYRFTAPTDGQLVVSAFGSGFSPGLGVFSGTCESLTPMSCNVGSSSASFSNSVTAGTTSFFLAGGAAVTGGSLTFLLAFTPTTGQPTILLQPQNEIVLTGGGATFTVNAIGTLPLNYFWERDGTAIAGATNSNYTIDNLQLADSGSQFSCLVSNSLGTMLHE